MESDEIELSVDDGSEKERKSTLEGYCRVRVHIQPNLALLEQELSGLRSALWWHYERRELVREHRLFDWEEQELVGARTILILFEVKVIPGGELGEL